LEVLDKMGADEASTASDEDFFKFQSSIFKFQGRVGMNGQE
jgi:hypothetical protein